MPMLQLLQIADALKAHAAALEGVAGTAVGVSESLPKTPAVEIVIGDFRMRSEPAGGDSVAALDWASFIVGFYVPLTKNLEDDERRLVPIVEAFVNRLTDPATDQTLGGLVEDTRITGGTFDIHKRNNREYRAAWLDVFAGELGADV
jgi:hypothetical protein